MKNVKSTRLPRSTPVENDDTKKRLENGGHGSNGAAVASLGCDPGSGKEDRRASASLSNGGSAAAAFVGVASSSESKIYGTLANGHWCTRSHHVNGNHVTSPPPAERTSARLPKELTQISPQTSPEVLPLSPGDVIPSLVYLSTELSNKTRDDGEARNRAPDMADLALVYFPLTMKLAGSKSRPSNGETKHSASSKHSQKSRTNGGHRRCSRSASTMSSSSSNSNGSYDRMHLTDFELGTGSPNVLLSSPYEPTLTHLRLERLRIEEEHILEMKRKDELEKTRGPCPNWYMLKSSDFSRELKKHNELMNNKHSCQEMFHYRSTLELASKNFRDIQSNSN